MAETLTPISVEEYLRTSYDDADREYVDGVVMERNLGERDHSVVQKRLIGWFLAREASHGYYCFPEQRVQASETRFRVPDVCVYLGTEPEDQVFRTPPFLVIEILSPRDSYISIQQRIADYLSFGVDYVWVVDPRDRSAVVWSGRSPEPVTGGMLRTANPAIEIRFDEIFER